MIGSSLYNQNLDPLTENLEVSVRFDHLWTIDKKKNMSGKKTRELNREAAVRWCIDIKQVKRVLQIPSASI